MSDVCLRLSVWPCDHPATCPGRNSAFTLGQLGQTAAFCGPECRIKAALENGWFNKKEKRKRKCAAFDLLDMMNLGPLVLWQMGSGALADKTKKIKKLQLTGRGGPQGSGAARVSPAC